MERCDVYKRNRYQLLVNPEPNVTILLTSAKWSVTDWSVLLQVSSVYLRAFLPFLSER